MKQSVKPDTPDGVFYTSARHNWLVHHGKILSTTASATGLLSCLLELSTCKPAQVNNNKYRLTIANPGWRRHNFLFTCATLFRGSQAPWLSQRKSVMYFKRILYRNFACGESNTQIRRWRGGWKDGETRQKTDNDGRYQRQPRDQILRQKHF